jgi:serine/threonine-protein kinase RsbW
MLRYGQNSAGVKTLEVWTMGDVSLNVPAEPGFLHVVRAVVSGVAARQDVSFEAIEDLCLAANEAAGYLLALRSPARQLCLDMRIEGDMELRVRTDAPAPNWPPERTESLAWTILSSLVHDVVFTLEDGCPAIRLVVRDPNATPVDPNATPAAPGDGASS